ncbi:uncharacterized protein LOC106079932 [Biomphalaria glabrata]|uniref:Uncharacterized protein LOC106079932 n=1 Tax=Biomphalaria glabrata TaxID=6526 RepID=A0A2C9LFV0_BIOGL|nr:uncharacterized protein LOC106079932 [Biomphalaria glabrata]XP_055862250.1 uncharacterized protein LOC106079932 [Biomphalaria glabrata]XP_055862251.1 uncharacterized protein LOC106079932 [Biomphalaria glabrata]
MDDFVNLASLLLLAALSVSPATSCDFPKVLQIKNDDMPWYSHIRSNGSRGTEYYFRHNVMEIHYKDGGKSPLRWKCTLTFHDKLLLKREDHLINSYYKCAKFLFRSRSVVQVLWSHEAKVFDLALCDDKNLTLDTWPLVRFSTLGSDYTPCPFSGGYDMDIEDSQLGENGCNRMLRPMRMESECLGGEGVTFDFLSSNCLPDVKMFVKQKTTCVTNWKDHKNHYVILKRDGDENLWCLAMPSHHKDPSKVTAYLFADLSCRADADRSVSIRKELKFLTLTLHKRVFPSLCEDEYDKCSQVECKSYLKQECQKSCGLCSALSAPVQCNYPEIFKGTWFLKSPESLKRIEITDSNLSIENVGNFQCVSFPDSPSSVLTNMYTTVSLNSNGCRPRYTCLKLSTLGPSVLRYSLSQSYAWPALEKDFGSNICNEDRFMADPLPIDDMYRSYEGAGKPVVSLQPPPKQINCNLTWVHTVSATLPEGYVCMGSIFQACEDPTRLRVEFNSCSTLVPTTTDYVCIGDFEGHYWERILLVQNLNDPSDTLCFVFSKIYPIEAYSFVASQCDKKSFSFGRSGIRKPLLKLQYRHEPEPCKSVPAVHDADSHATTTPMPSEENLRDGHHFYHANSSGSHNPSPILGTGSQHGQHEPVKAGEYNDDPTTQIDGAPHRAIQDYSAATTTRCDFILMTLLTSSLVLLVT